MTAGSRLLYQKALRMAMDRLRTQTAEATLAHVRPYPGGLLGLYLDTKKETPVAEIDMERLNLAVEHDGELARLLDLDPQDYEALKLMAQQSPQQFLARMVLTHRRALRALDRHYDSRVDHLSQRLDDAVLAIQELQRRPLVLVDQPPDEPDHSIPDDGGEAESPPELVGPPGWRPPAGPLADDDEIPF